MCSKMETHDSYNDITSHDINFSGGLCRYLVLFEKVYVLFGAWGRFGKVLKVRYYQKQIVMFSLDPKIEQKYFFMSALGF